MEPFLVRTPPGCVQSVSGPWTPMSRPGIFEWPSIGPRILPTRKTSCRPIADWSPSASSGSRFKREDEMIDEIILRLDLGELTFYEDPDLGVGE